jgi:hypothetical protein
MLKITTHADAETTALKLEGKVTSPWIEELDRCWQEVTGSHQRHVLVDLTGVTFIDPEGKAFLARMWQQGATFHSAGCLNTCIVEEITKKDRADSSGRKKEKKKERKDKSII